MEEPIIECYEGDEVIVGTDGSVEVVRGDDILRLAEDISVEEVSLDEPFLQELMWAAAEEINVKSNDLLYLAPVAVVRATRQVHSGVLYKLEVKVGQTEHLKRVVDFEAAPMFPCAPKETGRHSVYVVEIWIRKDFWKVTVKELKEVEI
uniref:Cystatin domain-containing protein n=1 Tax=Steinernema glaseri TaxID=37863 RepID=A0A1I8ACK9_9BILA